MLKKSALAASLILLPAAAALADDDIGCGAGTILWEGQSGVAAKVLAATTNGIFGNQTFGISSGTLGCSQGGVITADARTSMFASANMDQLAAEIAAGEGETLDALAALYEVEAADREAFTETTQRHFEALFGDGSASVADVLARLDAVLAEDERLARYV